MESKIVTAYDYRDEKAVLLYQNCRFEPKDFKQRSPDGKGGWTWGRNGTPATLYRLPELLQAPAQDWVCFAEGEKDADNLSQLGFVATTSGGANSWLPRFADYFRGRLVVIFPDADEPGAKFTQTVAKCLCAVAAEVRIVELPDGHKDVSDWIESRDSLDERELRAAITGMIDSAKPVKAEPVEKDADAALRPIYVSMRDVEAKPVKWFWRQRLAYAMLSMLVGIEGLGKTFLALYLAACATRGRLWPDAENDKDAPTPGNVILLTSEDHLEYTIRPRFDAMGGDPARLFALKGVRLPDGEDFFDVTQHLPALETMIQEIGDVRLVIADPLTAYLGTTDQHKNGEVRMALARFNALAERYGCAVVGISHLTKDASKAAIHRTLGSVAFSAAARSILLVAQDKEDAARRLLVPVKSNLGPLAKTLAFKIQDMVVQWEAGQFDCTADEVLAVSDTEDRRAIDDACKWLRGLLADGRMRSTEILNLAKRESFVEKTVRRAKCKLGVVAVKEGIGTGAVWYWKLP